MLLYRVGVPTPPYILELREHIGHELLLLPAVTAVLVRETESGPQVLLGRRSDDGQWSLPAGIVEPGEQPAATLVGGRSLRRPASSLASIG